MRVGIGLGSNQGVSADELAAARGWLRSLDPGARFSGVYETEPIDCPEGSPKFLNQTCEIRWNRSLMALLNLLQAYEMSRGRKTVRGRNQPRVLDLDLLYAGENKIQNQRLQLPHPRMGERRFVMEPLAEICPGRKVPGLPGTVRETAGWLQKEGVCRQIG